MKIVALLKAQLVATVITGVVLVGGATAVVTATPAGQQIFHASSNATHVTKTPDTDQQSQKGQTNACAGLADAQHLATTYALTADSQSSAVQAICALHTGTFTGTTPGGSAVSASRVFGYGEINQLLTYAQYLATHDQANDAGKLTDQNVGNYLAEALQSCGTTALEQCLKTNIRNYQPGNGGGNGNSGGKPTGSPTPHH